MGGFRGFGLPGVGTLMLCGAGRECSAYVITRRWTVDEGAGAYFERTVSVDLWQPGFGDGAEAV